MGDLFPGVWGLTPIAGMLGMLALMYWLLASGRLVPRASHERELAAESKRADGWEKVAGGQETLIHKLADQNGQLMESGQTLTALLKAAGPAGFSDTTLTRGS